jgi:hypothetical protein
MTRVAVCECLDISTGGKTHKLRYKGVAFEEVTADVVRIVVRTGGSWVVQRICLWSVSSPGFGLDGSVAG